MSQEINGARKMIVKSAVMDYVEGREDEIQPGSPEYEDLMANVTGQVTAVLEENGVIEY